MSNTNGSPRVCFGYTISETTVYVQFMQEPSKTFSRYPTSRLPEGTAL